MFHSFPTTNSIILRFLKLKVKVTFSSSLYESETRTNLQFESETVTSNNESETTSSLETETIFSSRRYRYRRRTRVTPRVTCLSHCHFEQCRSSQWDPRPPPNTNTEWTPDAKLHKFGAFETGNKFFKRLCETMYFSKIIMLLSFSH